LGLGHQSNFWSSSIFNDPSLSEEEVFYFDLSSAYLSVALNSYYKESAFYVRCLKD